MKSTRRLAAIMFTDIVGYTALMSQDEVKAFGVLKVNRAIQSAQIKRYRGRWLKEIGDGVLASFDTVTDAVCCAAAIQRACKDEPDLNLRIGIHQGEVVFENGDVFGDGVNIASRIEGMAPPGGIYVSRSVYQNISNNKEIVATHVEDAILKNISYKIGIYAVEIPDSEYLDKISDIKNSAMGNQHMTWLRPVIAVAILISLIAIWRWSSQSKIQHSDNLEKSHTESMVNETKMPGVELPTGPKIAVLPFKNLSNNKEQEYFSDGLTEDIITALSHTTDLFVLGFSPRLHNIKDLGVRDLGQELGVRYLLKGSVRRDANNIKVSAQLFDAETEGQIWGESYSRDSKVSDIFAIQDEITMRVVGAIADGGIIARMNLAELNRNPTKYLGAYECVLRSYAYEEAHTAQAHLLARDCLESALELDSTYADAMGILAYLYREEYTHDFNQRPNALERAINLANKALEIDPQNQNAFYALAFTYFEFQEAELAEFFNASKRAIAINPNNTRVIGGLGVLIALAGEWEWGIDLLTKTMTINPYSTLRPWLNFVKSSDYYNKGDYSNALTEVNQVSFLLPIVQVNKIAINAQLNNRDVAKAELEQALSSDSMFLKNAREELEKFYLVDKDLVDKLLAGLNKASSWQDKY